VRVSSHIQEVSDHTRLLSDWEVGYEQLSHGRFDGSLREAWVGGVHLYEESLSQIVFQSGVACSGQVALGVFTGLSGEARWFGNALTTDDVMFLNSGDEVLLTTPKESSLLVLCVPHDFPGDTPSPFLPRNFIRDAALASRIRHCIQGALSTLLSRPLHFANKRPRTQFCLDMQGLVGDYLDRCADEPIEVTRDRAHSVVKSAINFVAERRDEIPSIDDICRQTFTSRRTLQNCFERITGESPAFFLKAQRLNAVRREILRGNRNTRIGDVAANWGFWHLSQFSSDYKRLFGEVPSETLRFAQHYMGH
jgi:AraC family ethanolamine operon transcriptional activator